MILYLIDGINQHLYVKVGVDTFGYGHCARMPHNLFDDSRVNASLSQHGDTGMATAVWCAVYSQLFYEGYKIAIIVISGVCINGNLFLK